MITNTFISLRNHEIKNKFKYDIFKKERGISFIIAALDREALLPSAQVTRLYQVSSSARLKTQTINTQIVYFIIVRIPYPEAIFSWVFSFCCFYFRFIWGWKCKDNLGVGRVRGNKCNQTSQMCYVNSSSTILSGRGGNEEW